MEVTKRRRGIRGFRARQRDLEQNEVRQSGGPTSLKKWLELAWWGTVIWGVIRLAAHFLNLTPYGLGAFARPILDGVDENTAAAVGLGAMFLFVETLLATALFAVLFQRVRIWWSGLAYGVAMLAVAGFFFRIGNWEVSTLSTEAAWYLSFGLFVGMTLTLERSDDQE